MSNMGEISTKNALRNLWELTADHMEPKQLKEALNKSPLPPDNAVKFSLEELQNWLCK
jgi:hypothetical protein